jgi:hypothetical protein
MAGNYSLNPTAIQHTTANDSTTMNEDLFGNPVDTTTPPPRTVAGIARNNDGSFVSNPLVRLFGKGPERARCKACKHLWAKKRGKTYFKCLLRPGTVNTCSPLSDHRANWWACAKFEPKTTAP